jgi:hypothetical protein
MEQMPGIPRVSLRPLCIQSALPALTPPCRLPAGMADRSKGNSDWEIKYCCELLQHLMHVITVKCGVWSVCRVYLSVDIPFPGCCNMSLEPGAHNEDRPLSLAQCIVHSVCVLHISAQEMHSAQ